MATTNSYGTCRAMLGCAIGAAASMLTAPLFAQQAGGDVGAQASTDDIGHGGGQAREGFLAGAKLGGIMPFSGMSPFIAGGLEVGWVFDPGNIGIYLDVSYATPKSDGTLDDPRVPLASYDWKLTQKQLVLQPTFLYRFTGGSIIPYFGLGPRMYLTESVTTSEDPKLVTTQERSTEFGVGVPLGAELVVGPGGLFAELLLQWGPLDHSLTGDTHFGAASLFIGYRAIL